MIRRLVAVVFLGALLFVVWRGRGWFGGSSDLRATLVFDAPARLVKGEPVLHGDERIGAVESITPLGGQIAARIRVEGDRRSAIRSDSLIRLTPAAVVVDSNFAVGRPVEDGAVLHARDSAVARLLERGGAAIVPAARKAEEKASALLSYDRRSFDRQLDSWNARLPQWRAEGKESVQRHLDAVKRETGELEASLRAAGRKLEADQLRARFSEWQKSVRERLSE